VPADMIDLVKHRCAVGMAFIGDASEVGNDLVAFGEKIPANQDAGSMGRYRFDNDHAGAATGALSVVSEMSIARQTFVAHVDGMRAEYDPVLQRPVANFDGRENLWIVPRHDHLLRAVFACTPLARGETLRYFKV
jgi:hypothetical protein